MLAGKPRENSGLDLTVIGHDQVMAVRCDDQRSSNNSEITRSGGP